MLHARHYITQKSETKTVSLAFGSRFVRTYSYSDIDAQIGHLVAMFWS